MQFSGYRPSFVSLFRKKENRKKQADEESNRLQQRGEEDRFTEDYEDNFARTVSPVPNFGKDRKSNLDYMSDLYKDADLSNLKRANKNTRF